ncbi:MAG: hypothetical protein HYY16_03115 [Planctomycetes bacterium]|nr:hypothetical protein [Planctomycetota bacterium]
MNLQRVSGVVVVVCLLLGGRLLAFTGTGGGYTVIDNVESNGPTFLWDDIVQTGTPVAFSSSDMGWASVPIPFNFPFFGASYPSVTVATKGYLTFDVPSAVYYTNTSLPNVSAPNNTIACFWDSLTIPADGEARYQVLGMAPNRRLVILWKDATHFNGTSRRFTFQVALYEGSGAIRMQYRHMSNGSGTSTNYAAGMSATIGIEALTGNAGLLYLYNGAPASNQVKNGLAIGFLPDGAAAPWPTGPATSVYSEAFDGGATGFSFSAPSAPIEWAVDSTPAGAPGGPSFSAPNSLNFNDGTDYAATGVTPAGSATSPSIDIGGLEHAMLRFTCNYQTQASTAADDKRWLEISRDGFATQDLQAQIIGSGPTSIGICGLMGQWHEHIVPLNPAWGTIQVRFRFEALNSANNAFAGWFIDDVKVTGVVVAVGPPPSLPVPAPVLGVGVSKPPSIKKKVRTSPYCGGAAPSAGQSVGWIVMGMTALLLAGATRFSRG